jgi:hypothetical protein
MLLCREHGYEEKQRRFLSLRFSQTRRGSIITMLLHHLGFLFLQDAYSDKLTKPGR